MNREPAGVHDGTKLHNSYSIGLSDGTTRRAGCRSSTAGNT